MTIYLISFVFLLLGAIISIFVKERLKFKICTIFATISSVLISIPSSYVLFTGNVLQKNFYISQFWGYITLIIDPLSAFFILLISWMSLLGIFYSNGYMKAYLNKNLNITSHCFFLLMLIVSMLLVVTIQNALLFLIVWEIMSLSSFFLVIFESEKKEVISAGIKYLIYMHFSIIFILATFVLLNIHTGSLTFNDFIPVLQENKSLANIVFLLALTGFGIKSGLIPFHNWLPDAHPAAPSHVSAIMSGVMIKTGIYGILRILFLIETPSKCIAYTVFAIGLISALYGILYALVQKDLKKLLAYSSIENIGILVMGIGLGMFGLAYTQPHIAILGFSGAILHIFNHSIFKELLFFAAGVIYNKTHTRDMEMLGGLIKKLPKVASLFIIGSVAISALPPFNGFISEFLIYFGMLKGMLNSDINLLITLTLAIAGLAMVGTMALLTFTKASGITFLGQPRNDEIYNRIDCDAPASMYIPMSILAILALVIGMMPQFFVAVILNVSNLFVKINNYTIPTFVLSLMQFLSICFLILAFLILIIFVAKTLFNKKIKFSSTWSCGYSQVNPHIQYTGSSYISLFLTTLKPLFKRITHIKKPKELFPKEAHYEQDIEDIEEAYIVKPLLKWDEKILSKFERIQSGNIQQYILYGLIFLVISIIGLILFG